MIAAKPYLWFFSAVARKLTERGFAMARDMERTPDGAFALAWGSSDYGNALNLTAAARRDGDLRRWGRIVKGAQPYSDPETGEVWEKTYDLNWDHNLDEEEIADFRERVAEQFTVRLLGDWTG